MGRCVCSVEHVFGESRAKLNQPTLLKLRI
jgi:hypothetical protein